MFLASAVITAIAVGMTVGGAGAKTVAGTPLVYGKIPSLQGKTIAYIQTSSVDYFDKSRLGAEAAVKALGGKFISFNSQYKPAVELKNVQDAITRKVDGILLFSISQATFQTSTRLAKQAGIPVIDFYGYAPGVKLGAEGGFVQSDVLNAGVLDGKGMVAALGKCPGCQVAEVQGQLGRGDVEAYTKGFSSVVAKAGLKNVVRLTSHWSRAEAFKAMQDILSKYPDIKGVFCHNDDTAVGCVQALKQAGKKPGDVKVVTLNASSVGLPLLRQNWLQADVGWSPAQEGAIATRMIAQVIGKQTIKFPAPCLTPQTLVTTATVSKATSWIPTPALAKKWLLAPCQNQTAATVFGR